MLRFDIIIMVRLGVKIGYLSIVIIIVSDVSCSTSLVDLCNVPPLSTSVMYLPCRPPLCTYVSYLCCLPPLCISIVYFHCVSPLFISVVYLCCLPLLCTYVSYLCCVYCVPLFIPPLYRQSLNGAVIASVGIQNALCKATVTHSELHSTRAQ